jgi:hypothetical protein
VYLINAALESEAPNAAATAPNVRLLLLPAYLISLLALLGTPLKPPRMLITNHPRNGQAFK